MLGKTDPQANFFDSYIEEYFLPQEHEFLKIKEKVDFSFIEKQTRSLYARVAGRPSYPPEVMFKILFLEFYYNLSDVEVVKQLRFNVLFRYFAQVKIEDPLPDDTSLMLKKGLARYMNFYNQERPHQSLDYKTPAEVYFGIDNQNRETSRYLKKATFVS